MAISTKGISTVDTVSNISKVNSKSKSEEKSSDSFSSIMNMTSNNFNKDVSSSTDKGVDSISAQSTTKTASENNPSDNAKKTTDDNVKTDNVDKNEKNVKTESGNKFKKTEKTDAASDTVKSDDEKIEDIISEFATELVKLINNIKEMLEEKLGVSDEDIDNALSTLGFDMTDLINSKNVGELVLNIEEVSEVDILIDEQLANLIDDINSVVDDMIQNFEAFDIQPADFETEEVIDDKFIIADSFDNQQIPLKAVVEKADEIVKEEAKIIEDDTADYSDISETADNINDDVKITVNNNVESQTSKEGTSDNSNSFNESIISNLNNAINEVITEDVENTSTLTEDIQQADILRQVVDEIKANISNDVTTLDMRLNPESLGRVQITVSSRNGVMEARIVAETEAAKNAIEANLTTLRETLNNQELKVEAVEVTIANYGFFEEEQGTAEGNNQNNNNSKNNRVDSGIDTTDDDSSDTPLETEILRAQGSSVSYSI